MDECLRVMRAIETIHPSVFASEKYQASAQPYELSVDDIDEATVSATKSSKSVLNQNNLFNSNVLEKKIERSEEAKRIYARLKKVKYLLNELINKSRNSFDHSL